MTLTRRALFFLGLSLSLSLLGGGVTEAAAAAKPKDAAQQLRTEWKLADLKLQREAIDDASFAQSLKTSAMANVDWYLQQQEALIAQVQKSPATAAKARQTRAQLDAQFKQKMAAIYNDPNAMAELNCCMKALDKEIDDVAQSADKMFQHLDAVGVTAAQKAKLRPVVQQANADLKRTVSKSRTRSARDPNVREEVVSQYKDARKRIRQQLTPDQRQKLAKRLADEK